jgi:hypothetical protein
MRVGQDLPPLSIVDEIATTMTAVRRPVANQLGKRYVCAQCATQLLVTKPGPGMLECHGMPMSIEAAKPLPASD